MRAVPISDRIQFIDEDNCRAGLHRLIEKCPHFLKQIARSGAF